MATISLPELRQIIEVALDRDPGDISLESRLYEQLGFDSIGMVALVVEIQRRFGVRIPELEVPNLRTVQDIIVAIEA